MLQQLNNGLPTSTARRDSEHGAACCLVPASLAACTLTPSRHGFCPLLPGCPTSTHLSAAVSMSSVVQAQKGCRKPREAVR